MEGCRIDRDDMPESSLISIACIAGAYLLGSVPFGYLAGRLKGVDLRTCGSRNIGATNAGRVLGKKWGFIVFACDFLKGLLPVWWMRSLQGGDVEAFDYVQMSWLVASVMAVVLGHTFTCFLHFKGGKGVATCAGALFALSPFIGGTALTTWLLFMLVFRYVSLASMAAALAMVAAAWFEFCCGRPIEDSGWLVFGILSLLAILVIAKHRSNIERLINGTEAKSWVRKSQQ